MRPQLLSCLLLFSLVAACPASPASPPATRYNVRDFGAVGDGKTLDSPAINKAIEAAAAAGGGTVWLPAGTYLSGSIRLKSNLHIYMEAGAVILGAPQEMEAYDQTEDFPMPAYQDGGHSYFRNSLIWGENLTNVSITGPGMINGGGLLENVEKLNKMVGFRYTNDKNPPPITDLPNNGMPPVRIGNKAIALKLCRDVLIRDITIFHGGWFGILATGCDNLTLDNLTIDTNRDGIDIDCCRNVMISNCRVNAPMDDAICLKSSYALREPRLTENVTITNCQVSGFEEGSLLDGTMKPFPKRGTGRIKFGTEGTGGFRNITISNCTFRHCFGIALQQVDAGILENVTISNISMTDVKHYAIHLTTGKRNRNPSPTAPSRIRNVLISNVVADDVEELCAIQLYGLPEQPLEGIRLQNIRIHSRGGGTREDAKKIPPELGTNGPEASRWRLSNYGIFARHVRDLQLEDVTFTLQKEDLRPAAMFTNINGLQIDGFSAPARADIPVAEFAPDVTGIEIRNSPGISRH